jgi:hypothetical protein
LFKERQNVAAESNGAFVFSSCIYHGRFYFSLQSSCHGFIFDLSDVYNSECFRIFTPKIFNFN